MGMSLFAVVFFGFIVLFFVVFFGAIALAVVRGLRRRAQDDAAPIEELPARLVGRRQENRGGGETRIVTKHFVTFELNSGQRLELEVSGEQYGQLIEGDRGVLRRKGSRFLGFDRQLGLEP